MPLTGPLLRYVPVDSRLHRMWAGTKLAALAVLGATTAALPTWPVEAAVGAVLLLASVTAALPRRWLPRPPAWLVVATALPILVGALTGGAPYVHLGGASLGLGGLLVMLRGTGVALLFLYAALLLAATTRAADVAPALGTLLAPLRRARVPVDDVVAVTALSVRCLPLLVDEVTTTYAAWRLRLPARERRRIRTVGRFLTTVVAATTRRARELAEAMHARGGPAPASLPRPALGPADAVAAVMVGSVVAVAVLL